MSDPVEQLQRLKALLEQGVLTESVYQQQTTQLLSQMGLSTASSAHRSDAETRPDPLLVDTELGPTDGRFRLVELLGQGRMGEVWKALELRDDGQLRYRALKVLPLHLRHDRAALGRLREEAERSGELSHPHIVNTFGWRQGPEGIPFIIMAYVPGQTLRGRLLAKQRLDLATTLTLLRPVAVALDYAHGQQVIHRDVKPENIMLGPQQQVTLLDFSLSDAVKRSSMLGQRNDKDDSGTWVYMPPEAFLAGGGAHHPKRDIYALAVVLYECLSGELPFDGPLLAQRPVDLTIPCPPGLTAGAWAALQRGLHRDRTERPDTAEGLLDAIAEARPAVAVVSPSVAEPPAVLAFIHGWDTAQVQQHQQQTAQTLGLTVAFQDALQDGSAGPEMRVIPPGRFLMGSPDEEDERGDDERLHEVSIRQPFALASAALSFGWYDRFCAATDREKPEDKGWGRGEYPAILVSWWDAEAFCDWLSKETDQDYRLPSEAEWEYACRAGTITAFWWGDDIHPGQANYDGSEVYRNGAQGKNRQQTLPVRSLEANPWGLYQMHGNVWEWTGSAWGEGYAGYELEILSKNHTSYQDTPRVLRGGSWLGNPRGVRSANRYRYAPSVRDGILGFRLARSL